MCIAPLAPKETHMSIKAIIYGLQVGGAIVAPILRILFRLIRLFRSPSLTAYLPQRSLTVRLIGWYMRLLVP